MNRPADEARAGVGPHVGERLGAARPSGAGAHQRHRRRGVDHEPGGDQLGASAPARGAGQHDRAPRRDDQRRRRGGRRARAAAPPTPRRAPAAHTSASATGAPSRPAARLGRRASALPLASGGAACRPAAGSRSLGPAARRCRHAPSAPARNASAASSSAVTARRRGTRATGSPATSSRPVAGGDGLPAQVRVLAGHVAAAVVEGEQEPAGQRRPAPGRRTAPRSSSRRPGRARRRARPSIPDSGRGEMLRARSCVVDGSSPAAASRGGQPRVVAAQAAQLHVAPRGQVQRRRRRDPRRSPPPPAAPRRRPPAGQPHPGERAVGGVVQGEHPGAGVGAERTRPPVSARRRGPRHESEPSQGLTGRRGGPESGRDRQLHTASGGRNPVRIRRGPATVTGEQTPPTATGAARKAGARDDPGARRLPRRRAPRPTDGARTPREDPGASCCCRRLTPTCSAPARAAPRSGWPTRPAPPSEDLPALLDGADLVVVRFLGGSRDWQEGLDALLRLPACPWSCSAASRLPDAELMAQSTVPAGRRRARRTPTSRRAARPTSAAARLPVRHGPAHRSRLRPARRRRRPGGRWSGAGAARPDGPVVGGPLLPGPPPRGQHRLRGGALRRDRGRRGPPAAGLLRVAAPAPSPSCWSTLGRADALVVTVLAAGGTRPADARRAARTRRGTWARSPRSTCRSCRGCASPPAARPGPAATRGCRPLDAATQVAVPEFDGRLITVPFSFKEFDADGLTVYVPDPERAARVAGIAVRHARLRHIPAARASGSC